MIRAMVNTPRKLHTSVTLNNKSSLSNYWITGFCDAEASFMVSFARDSKFKSGWRIKPCFSIHLHNKDSDLLHQIQSSFKGVGGIRLNKSDLSVNYSITSLKSIIDVIIPHFDTYPLITQKAADYLLFKRVVYLMLNKEHLTDEGLRKVVSIRAVMNNGLSEQLSKHFTNLTLVQRPEVEKVKIEDPNWISGFTDGEGTFIIYVTKAPGVTTGHSVSLRFTLTQHVKDQKLLELLAKYFDFGWLAVSPNRPLAYYNVTKFSDICNINNFFCKYPLKSNKLIDFRDFEKATLLIESKSHLTLEGLNQLRSIKQSMNRSRDLSDLE